MLTMTKGTGIFLKIFADCWVTNRLKFHKGVNKVILLKNAHFCTLYTQFIGEFLYI